MTIHWITYETNPEIDIKNQGSHDKLKKTADKFGWKLRSFGKGKAWKGFTSKWISVKRSIRNLPDSDIVVVTDARDVLCLKGQTGFSTILRKLDKNGKRVVFSSEQACCVQVMKENPIGTFVKKGGRRSRSWAVPEWKEADYAIEKSWVDAYQKRQKVSSFKVLNAGMACGRVKAWKKALGAISPLKHGDDDQAVWSDAFMNTNYIALDYNQELLSNTNILRGLPNGCYIKRQANGVFKNRITKSEPFIVQTPGAPWDYPKPFGCYMRIYNQLKPFN